MARLGRLELFYLFARVDLMVRRRLDGIISTFEIAGFDGAACAATPTLKRHEWSSWAPYKLETNR